MNCGATNEDQRPAMVGSGSLVLVVGPSGAGKDTLIRHAYELRAGDDRIVFPRRSVTRPPSAFEDNESVSLEQFNRLSSSGGYALWWRAHGHCYGLPRSIDEDIRRGKIVVANVSRAIVDEAKRKYEKTFTVVITAPVNVLASRLEARKRDGDGDLQARLARASAEPAFKADATICNIGDVEDHARELVAFLLSICQMSNDSIKNA